MRSSLSLALLLLLSCSIPAWGQSSVESPPPSDSGFQDAKIYQVPGTLLNRLQADLLTAKSQLSLQAQELTKLRSELTDSSSLLKQAQEQLTTASQSYNASRIQTAVSCVAAVAVVAALEYFWLTFPKRP